MSGNVPVFDADTVAIRNLRAANGVGLVKACPLPAVAFCVSKLASVSVQNATSLILGSKNTMFLVSDIPVSFVSTKGIVVLSPNVALLVDPAAILKDLPPTYK